MLASIPSPPLWASKIEIGPVQIHVYAIMILCAIAVAIYFTDKRFVARGGLRETTLDVAIWAVPSAIVGARLYHCISNWDEFFPPNGNMWLIPKIWEGGLAIIGGVLTGAVVAYWYLTKRRHMRLGPFADSLAPILPLAQAIGRIGNYFNNELFGAPTTLPWGLQVDSSRIPSGYSETTLFHPTFLYEMICNIVICLFLLKVDKARKLACGQLFSLYMICYGTVRFLLEFVRIDVAYEFLGIRFNAWAALVVVLVGIIAFVICGKVNASTTYTSSERQKFAPTDNK